jgi:MFS family permease
MTVTLLDLLAPAEFRLRMTSDARRLFMYVFVAFFAMGLTLSLYVVFLHNVHHFSLGFSSALLSAGAMLGLITSPLWGTLTDRFGPVPALLVSRIGSAGSLVWWAFIHSKAEAVGASLLLAFFAGGSAGPSTTLLTRQSLPDDRSRVYGLNFILINLGIGLGALVSTCIVSLNHPVTFEYLYLFNAAVTMVAAAIVVPLWGHGHYEPQASDPPERVREGWGAVVRDGRLVRFMLAFLVMMIGGWGSMEAGFSLFVVNNLHYSVHLIGVITFFNASTIVLAQVFVTNRLEGRSRMGLLATAGLAWGVFWFSVAACIALPRIWGVVVMCLGMVIFSLGETLMAPTSSSFINDIAPEHLRGRYNTVGGLIWTMSTAVAPILTSLYFENGLGNWWPFATGCATIAGGFMLWRFRRRISAFADGRRESAAT